MKRYIDSDISMSSRQRVDCDEVVDFLIVGAQKAGTMAAVKNLNKHPDIFVLSECHFFDLYWNMGLDWYKSKLHVGNIDKKPIIGEKTPELIYVDDCAVRIKQVSPNAKFILFLRDPIKRAFSSWNMQRSRGLEELPFDECVERELNSMMGEMRTFGTAEYHYIQKGFYFDQIERFMKVFSNRNQMLIVIAEVVRNQPHQEYTRIFNFLGVRDIKIDAEDDHVGSYADKIPKKLEAKLRKLYAPHNERLFKFLGYRITEWDPPVPVSATNTLVPSKKPEHETIPSLPEPPTKDTVNTNTDSSTDTSNSAHKDPSPISSTATATCTEQSVIEGKY